MSIQSGRILYDGRVQCRPQQLVSRKTSHVCDCDALNFLLCILHPRSDCGSVPNSYDSDVLPLK